MGEFNENYQDIDSTYDEIQDFDLFDKDEEEDRNENRGEKDFFYRSLDEY